MSRVATRARTELASSLALEIRTVSSALKRRLRERSERHDLTPTQVAVVLRLETLGSATVSTLARAEAMRPQSMSAVVAPLLEAGFVGGEPDPNDGRRTLLSLTTTCVRWLREGRAARQDWLADSIAAKLTANEQRALLDAMALLTRLVEA